MLDFSLYSEIAKWIGWPAISAALTLIITITIFFYNQQIKILKEENIRQQKEIENIKNYNADQLIRRLKERHKLAMEELDFAEEKILLKEKELENIKSEKNFSEKSNKDKIEKLESIIEILKNEYEVAKKLAVNKELELEVVISQAKEIMEDLKKRLSEKNS